MTDRRPEPTPGHLPRKQHPAPNQGNTLDGTQNQFRGDQTGISISMSASRSDHVTNNTKGGDNSYIGSEREKASLPSIQGSSGNNKNIPIGSSAWENEVTDKIGMAGQDALPGEFSDGRMGADISMLISDITDHRDLLNRHTAEDKENLAALEAEIELLEYRQMKIESRLQKRRVAKEEYEKTLADTERAFKKIVETANSVANILKPPSAGELAKIPMPTAAKQVKMPQEHDPKHMPEVRKTTMDSKIKLRL
jgi:Sjoegren syndrome nuclear autoantigen 1